MPKKGCHNSEETKQRIKDARARQVHPRLARRGITLEMLAEAQSNGLRWCSGKCKGFRPAVEFSTGAKTRKCRLCTAQSVARRRSNWTEAEHAKSVQGIKDWRKANAGYDREWQLQALYGLTPGWYESKFEEQGGVCAICGSAQSSKRSSLLFVDHNHETGIVRGLLCHGCNIAISRFETIPGWAERVAGYLALHSRTEGSINA